MSLNTIKIPSLEQLGEVVVELGLALPEAELAAHHQSLLGALEAYSRLAGSAIPSFTGMPRTIVSARD